MPILPQRRYMYRPRRATDFPWYEFGLAMFLSVAGSVLAPLGAWEFFSEKRRLRQRSPGATTLTHNARAQAEVTRKRVFRCS